VGKIAKLINLAKEKEGGISHSVATWRLHLTGREARELIEEAVNKGYIRVLKQGSATKPGLVYKWTGKELEAGDLELGAESLGLGEFIDITDEYLAKTKID